MAQHTRPEILRPVNSTLSAERPTCHLCSWVGRPPLPAEQARGVLAVFTIKRPSGACLVVDERTGRSHRSLLDASPSPALATWLKAS